MLMTNKALQDPLESKKNETLMAVLLLGMAEVGLPSCLRTQFIIFARTRRTLFSSLKTIRWNFALNIKEGSP